MSSPCRTDRNPVAKALCWYWDVTGQLETPDPGWDRTVFAEEDGKLRPERERVGVDSFWGTPEIYDRILDRHPHWLETRTKGDEEARGWLEARMARIHQHLSGGRPEPGSLDYQMKFARKIFHDLVSPRTEGGFGLTFDTAPGGTRTLADIARDRKATCLEFVHQLLMPAARMARIPLVPLELLEKDGRSQMHVGAGLLDLTTGKLRFVIDFQERIHVGRPRRDEVWSEISNRELLAYYYNARGVRNSNPQQAEAEIDFALRLSPDNYFLLFNKAYYALERGNPQESENLLLRSIDANPLHAPTYAALHTVASRLHHDELASWSWTQLVSYRL
jgi:tetratricopeptide (TPR) repeat protein